MTDTITVTLLGRPVTLRRTFAAFRQWRSDCGALEIGHYEPPFYRATFSVGDLVAEGSGKTPEEALLELRSELEPLEAWIDAR